MEEKEELISTLQDETYKHNLIFNSTDEAMVVIDTEEKIIFFNKSAERMTEVPIADAIGKHIVDVIPKSQLPR